MASPAPPGYFQARVKSALSGDTLILSGVNNPKQERALSLAFVSAPRLKRDGDEVSPNSSASCSASPNLLTNCFKPFAFESREFIRKSLVGRVILFKPFYTIPTTKREYGVILVQGGTQYPEKSVAEGYARLRDDAGKKEESEEAVRLLERLQVSEARAKADSKGLWAESGGKIDSAYELPDPKAFLEKNKNKSIDGVVEKVLTGDRLIVRLFMTPTSHVQTMILIAGIKAPSTKRQGPGEDERQGEPFGDDAHLFIESRLLQRNIQVELLGVSPQNQLVATVKHPTQGSVAPHILKAGFARCTDFHSTLLGSEMGA